ncbi:hypothetical protein JVT61DRAFT_12713 [Boletus reticuloceps]|uniref:Uncharacterized protein n=1 Tax=Boletus reticuloceps TaxID=495285 RepID=A0A8I2YXL1_9AGAM|nr:hypothetical protein JVT61DRAFT_12713 [Boletus reticuloceps]
MTIGSMRSATLFGGGDSISHLGGSVLGDPEGENTSQFLVDDDRLDVDCERDVDASLRALRPRSFEERKLGQRSQWMERQNPRQWSRPNHGEQEHVDKQQYEN